jgi:hypothetical protein
VALVPARRAAHPHRDRATDGQQSGQTAVAIPGGEHWHRRVAIACGGAGRSETLLRTKSLGLAGEPQGMDERLYLRRGRGPRSSADSSTPST